MDWDQPPLFIEFSRREYWSGLPCPSPGDLLDPEIEPGSPALHADSSLSEPPGKSVTLQLTLKQFNNRSVYMLNMKREKEHVNLREGDVNTYFRYV